MSYDYIIWRRSPTTKTAMLAEVYRATGEGNDHPAMAPFDTVEVDRSLREAFGDVNSDPDGPFLYSFDKGRASPWLSIAVNHSQVEAVTPGIISVASKHGLIVYDPQRGAVWGNRRV